MNRKLSPLIVVALFTSLAALAQATGAAAPAAPAAPAASTTISSKVGIIDLRDAILSTNEGKRDIEALQQKFAPKSAELKKLNDDVEDMKKRLSTQQDKLNDDARANLVREIDSKGKTLQRQYEDAQGDFNAQQNDIFNRIGSKMVEVLDKYARDNGYSVIFDVSNPQSPVVWANTATVVTGPIVALYNAQSGVPPTAAPAAKPAAAVRPAAPPKAATPAAKPAAPAKPQ
jgi:outer membrane protein